MTGSGSPAREPSRSASWSGKGLPRGGQTEWNETQSRNGLIPSEPSAHMQAGEGGGAVYLGLGLRNAGMSCNTWCLQCSKQLGRFYLIVLLLGRPGSRSTAGSLQPSRWTNSHSPPFPPLQGSAVCVSDTRGDRPCRWPEPTKLLWPPPPPPHLA